MSDQTDDREEQFFGNRLSFLNKVIKITFHNYALCAVIIIGSFILGVMGSFTGIGGALGTGVAYGLVQKKKKGFTRGFLIGASMVLIILLWGALAGQRTPL